MDRELFIGFIEEAKGYIPKVLDDIEAFKENPGRPNAIEEAYRFMHTIKGASSMMGLSTLSEAAYYVEEALEGIAAGQIKMDGKTTSLLRDTVGHIETYLDCLLSGESDEQPILAGVPESFRHLKESYKPEDEAFAPKESTNGISQSDEIPPELVEVFMIEASEYLQNISNLLFQLEKNPEDKECLQDIRRSVHTLKGAAGVVGFESVSQLSHRMEDVLDKLYDGGMRFSSDVMSLLFATSEALDGLTNGKVGKEDLEGVIEGLYWRYYDLLAELPSDEGASPVETSEQNITEDMAARLMSALEVEDNAASEEKISEVFIPKGSNGISQSDEIPPELMEVFMVEANEHLQNISNFLSELEKAPEDKECLQNIRRSVHTLKGAAGVVGFGSVSQLSHRMEDLLDKLYDGGIRLSSPVMNLLFATSDVLDDLTNGKTDKGNLEDTVQELHKDYAASLNETPSDRSMPTAEVSKDKVKPSDEEIAGLDEIDSGSERRRVSEYAEKPASAKTRKPGEFVRIPIERLDELVNLVSELVVNRSSFEQYLRRFVHEVDELQPSIGRLQRVSTKIGTQYEVVALRGEKLSLYGKTAVGISNAQPANSNSYEFDDLEFDRYTEFHLHSRELTETTSDISAVGNELRYVIGDFDTYLDRQGRLVSEVQDKLMRLRMVPLSNIVMRLNRTVRVTATQRGKLVDFTTEGEHVEIDKTVLEEIADPLLHILRNAVDHGIEPPDVRRALGKPEGGQIRLRAYYEGTQVVIQVSDDGAGLDPRAIRLSAVSGGFISESNALNLSDEELYSLIFLPGFSTAREVSEVSGRGVGMDVVKSTVHKMKGSVSVASTFGRGAAFTIRLPMTLAITRVLMVKSNSETFAIPLGAVTQILRIHKDEIEHIGQESVIRVEGRVYPLVWLGETLGLKQPPDGSVVRLPVLILSLGGKHVALAVDQLLEARQVVFKNLGNHLRRVRGIAGATLMGDGSVVFILNPDDLVGEAYERQIQPMSSIKSSLERAARRTLDILIVDDSLSVRRVLSNLIKSKGWNPVIAKDGVEALEVIQRSAKIPDVILLDIEMPRMDGYELTSILRTQEAYRDIPIIIITSRAGEKHRQKAFQIGVTEYVVKPYQDELLLNVIRRFTQESGRRMIQ